VPALSVGIATATDVAPVLIVALILLGADSLSPEIVRDTLNVLLKFEPDIAAVEPQISELLRRPAA